MVCYSLYVIISLIYDYQFPFFPHTYYVALSFIISANSNHSVDRACDDIWAALLLIISGSASAARRLPYKTPWWNLYSWPSRRILVSVRIDSARLKFSTFLNIRATMGDLPEIFRQEMRLVIALSFSLRVSFLIAHNTPSLLRYADSNHLMLFMISAISPALYESCFHHIIIICTELARCHTIAFDSLWEFHYSILSIRIFLTDLRALSQRDMFWRFLDLLRIIIPLSIEGLVVKGAHYTYKNY